MSSEFNHMDHFLRKKEEESTASSSRRQLHWEQMKKMLNTSTPSTGTTANRFWNLGWIAAAIMILTTGIWFLTKEAAHKTSLSDTSAKTNTPDSLPVKNTILTLQSVKTTVKVDSVKLLHQSKVLPLPHHVILQKDSLNILTVPPVLISNQDAYHSFFQSLEKPFETFLIDNEKDTTITCKEGTIILIPAKTFVSALGSSSSQVTFRVREFYDIADIVAHKLTTSSFNSPLVTGGMLYMEALVNAKPVKILSGGSIKITMPTEKFDGEMQLFTGVTGKQVLVQDNIEIDGKTDTTLIGRGMNWTAMGQQQFSYAPPAKIVNVLDLTNSPKKVTGKKNQSIAHFKIPYKAPGSTAEIKKQLEDRYGGQYTEIKVKRQHKPITIFNFYTGKKYQRNESDPFVGDTISIPLKVASKLKLINSRDSLRFEELYAKNVEAQLKWQQAYLKDYNQRKQYNFSITSLGWINCDKFLNSREKKIPFLVNTGKGFENNYFESFLIFKDFNGIMPGYWQDGTITFSNIPIGQKVSAVCIGVKDGKAYYAIRDLQVNNDQVTLEMKETSPEAFREQLKRFGNVKGG